MHSSSNSHHHRRVAPAAAATLLLALAVAALLAASAGEAARGRRADAPVNTAPPVISGSAEVGQTLSTSTGTWQSSSTITLYTYHWARCDTSGNGCSNVPGATNQTYTVVAADAGHAIRVYVTANNADGYTTQRSAPTAGGARRTAEHVSPDDQGNPVIGQILTATAGSWQSRTTPTYTFLWGRCNSSGSGCSNISGRRSQTYVPTNRDVGHTLIVYVTANNSAGATTAHSKATARSSPSPACRRTRARRPSAVLPM